MDKFRNKYRIQSTRLRNWDYGWNAAYYVTVCTKNRKCYFGEIKKGIMKLSDIGKIVETEWLKTIEIRPDMNLKMDAYVVMPNHFHAIIIIGKNQYNMKNGMDRGLDRGRYAMHCVSTNNAGTTNNTAYNDTNNVDKTDNTNNNDNAFDPNKITENNPNDQPPKNQFGPQSKNLASIMRGFKSAVTTNARIIQPKFEWQAKYHDHIIRDDSSFKRIRNYIINNPKKWKDDEFNNK